tara:strand:+ start:443 stop:664 length:222 start_codon:yes stop_codon:yes gene_type:complete
MNWNEYRRLKIEEAMDKKDINKIQLKEYLGVSYPTMLNKLKDTGTFKLSEFDKVCTYLNLDINELIIDNGKRN